MSHHFYMMRVALFIVAAMFSSFSVLFFCMAGNFELATISVIPLGISIIFALINYADAETEINSSNSSNWRLRSINR